jgi:D-aminoacyl-tRNA deacylase
MLRMRVVLQRVAQASVEVQDLCVTSAPSCVGRIARGWLVLLGVAQEDDQADALWLADKVLNLRGFEDNQGKMNLSVTNIKGSILVVSQFTLLADCRSGRRPSFTAAAKPPMAQDLYLLFTNLLKKPGLTVETGVFGAMMKVELINDGPVTFLLDSRN